MNPYSQNKVKVLRMADYFKPTPCAMATYSGDDIYEYASARTGLTQTQRDNLQSSVEGSSIAQMRNRQPIAGASFSSGEPIVMAMGKDETESAMAKEELDKKLERDILDNVDINFIFNKGARLANGLIDDQRLFSVMTKLKQLAYKQLENGQTEINYKEIVEYVKDKEGVFADDLVSDGATLIDDQSKEGKVTERAAGITSFKDLVRRPDEVGIANEEDEKNRRWGECVEFLRNNPKLLLQMVPDGGYEDEEDDQAKQKKETKKLTKKPNKKILLERLASNARKNNKMSRRIEEAKQFS